MAGPVQAGGRVVSLARQAAIRAVVVGVSRLERPVVGRAAKLHSLTLRRSKAMMKTTNDDETGGGSGAGGSSGGGSGPSLWIVLAVVVGIALLAFAFA